MDEASYQKIRRSGLDLRVINNAPEVFYTENRRRYIHKDSYDRCLFLQEQECSIHRELGESSKPAGCRQFPFRLVQTPVGVFAGVSLFCTAAQRNQGQPLQAHSVQLEGWIDEAPVVGETVSLDGQTDFPFTDYLRLESWILQGLSTDCSTNCSDLQFVLARLLWVLSQLVLGFPSQRLDELWEQSQQSVAPPEEPFRLFEDATLAELIGRVEFPQPSKAPSMEVERLSLGEQVPFPKWANQTFSLGLARQGNRVSPDFHRFVSGLVFRKWLLLRRPVFDNAILLYLMPQIFCLWAGLAETAGLDAPDLQAIDRCEYNFCSHAPVNPPKSSTLQPLDAALGVWSRKWISAIDRY